MEQHKQFDEPPFRASIIAPPKSSPLNVLQKLQHLCLQPAKNGSRSISVDLLRIFAASAIFYYHSGLFASWPLSRWGEFAVATFIYLTAYCTIRYSHSPIGRLRAYWWSRFKAIYPTFAIISILIYVANFFYTPPKTGSHYTFSDLAANLLMISQYVGKPWMTASMWFVPFVLQIYLILPFFVRIPIRLYTLPVMFLVSGTACAIVYALHPSATEQAYGICRNWSPLFRLPEVLLGCMLARSRSLADAIAPIATYVAFCVLVALLAAVYPGASSTLLLPFKGVLVFVVLAAMTAALLPFIKNELSGVVALFGRAAFPFWLLHGPGVTFMGDKFGQNILPWVLYFVLCWAGAVIFTITLDRVVRRVGHRRSQRLQSARWPS